MAVSKRSYSKILQIDRALEKKEGVIMEMQELKEIWNQYDRKLDRTVKLNIELLKTIKLEKVRSKLQRSVFSVTLELVINMAAIVMLGSFLADHVSMIRFAAPALVLEVAAILLVISNVYQLTILKTLDYGAPVMLIQKRLETLRAHRIQVTQWILAAGALIWAPLLIVGLKAFFNVDAYVIPGSGYLLSSLVFGLIVILVAVIVSKKYVDRFGHSPFVKKLMDDISGRNLNAATKFIQEMELFEKEDGLD